jgi:hypothetical protein
MLKSHTRIVVLAAVLFLIMTLLPIPIGPSLLSESALASSCAIEMTQPELASSHSGTLDVATAGEEFVLTVIASNCTPNKTPFIALIEVRNSEGITEHIGWQSGILAENGKTQIGISWIPAHGDNYGIRSFAITDWVMPNVLSTVSTSNVEIAEANTEKLALEFQVTKTDLTTQEPFGTSYYLVNNGSYTVSLTVDDYIGVYESFNGKTPQRLGPDSSCTWQFQKQIEHPDVILKPGEMMNLTERSAESAAPTNPGIYYYSPFVILSVQGQERVKCMEIVGNTVILNVTAPVYEGVSLVLQTDKEKYRVDEVVHFTFFIENASDEPFVLTEEVPLIKISSSNGTEVLQIGFVADHVWPITIEPHSTYRLDDLFPLDWDLSDIYQVPPEKDGNEVQATPGVYFINATFTYPYLESKTFEISVEK